MAIENVCGVVEGYLLPQGETEAVGEDRQHLVGWMVVDSNQVRMDALRAGEHRRDLVDGGQGSAARRSLANRHLPLFVQRHTVEDDGFAI